MLPFSTRNLAAVWLSALLLTAAAGAPTLPSDKQALMAFKRGLAGSGAVLADWTPDTDPCQDLWTGVKCDCRDFFASPNQSEQVCTAPTNSAEGSPARVLQLNLGDPRITQWDKLSGTVSPALGALSALRVLNLNGNSLYGSLPPELRALSALEQLLARNNRLTGGLPAYLGSMPALRYVSLDGNYLGGPLPGAWCNGSWWYVHVEGNAGLCDEVPPCLHQRVTSLEGTSLIDVTSGDASSLGGYCGVLPPTCAPAQGCRIVGPDPAFWTNGTSVAFSFTEFDSPAGGGDVSYRWAVGTTRWGLDVLDWIDFDGYSITQAVQVVAGGSVTKKVFYVDHPLAQVSLREGATYYVTVQGFNGAGLALGTMLSSRPILADMSPPALPPGSTVYSSPSRSDRPTQSATSSLGASWDPFSDPETGVVSYSYQVYAFATDGRGEGGGYVGAALTGKIKIGEERSVSIINLDLAPGGTYFVRVIAMNGAGVEGYSDAPPVTVLGGSAVIMGGGLAAKKVIALCAVLVGVTAVASALVAFWATRERFRRREGERKAARGQARNFRHLLHGLVHHVGDTERRAAEELGQLKELAFVITDLENSTGIAADCPQSFEKVQDTHDSLIRDLIGRYGGYEINTEGDAFHVAFKAVQQAVEFCMEVQYQMMEQEWPAEVLRLPGCKEVRAPDGATAFRGPRVRIGVHWAAEGTMVQQLHTLTKHRVFTGPAFQATRELCEGGAGGQVLLSHDAWRRLQGDMAGAGFPTVEQLGQYRLEGWPVPLWIYHVTQLLGRPLPRELPPPEGLERLEGGWGLCIMPPPQPRAPSGELAFVSARLALETCAADTVSPAMGRRLYEAMAEVAMQFGGYIYRLSESKGWFLLAFASGLDAVRFCHATQVLLMQMAWPAAEWADFVGPPETAADGRPVFRGPRVAMGVHQSREYGVQVVPREQAAADEVAVDYHGPAEEVAKLISEACHGGEVVLSEATWGAVQDHLPGQAQVVSLGTHVLEAAGSAASSWGGSDGGGGGKHASTAAAPAKPPGPMLLMEVMPAALARRSFPAPRTAAAIDPGYRDAPALGEDMAIVYVKVSKPREVVEAEQARPAISDDTLIQ